MIPLFGAIVFFVAITFVSFVAEFFTGSEFQSKLHVAFEEADECVDWLQYLGRKTSRGRSPAAGSQGACRHPGDCRSNGEKEHSADEESSEELGTMREKITARSGPLPQVAGCTSDLLTNFDL
jgi:hypothetical protein